MNREQERLLQDKNGECRWKDWGPYLSDRQWGTVREDYSAGGDAWTYLPHDHARSRAYRWGEDGIAGWSDKLQRLCFSLALWNGNDPILKERFFGLANAEGNHGEDVKELYYYLDATPSHAYLQFLYKYPQAAYPYDQLVAQNAARGKEEGEWELLDSGVLDGDRYFDVYVEYARASCDDLLIRITAHNRGSEDAPLHLLPHLWFRNTWSWGEEEARPHLEPHGHHVVAAHHATLGEYFLHFEAGEPLFTENETNRTRLFGEAPAAPPGGDPPPAERVKDAFHRHIVEGVPLQSAADGQEGGTRCAVWSRHSVPAGGQVQLRLRLTPEAMELPWEGFEAVFAQRKAEADQFYADLQRGLPQEPEAPAKAQADTQADAQADAQTGTDLPAVPGLRAVQRQALAGMIWSKQFYHWDVRRWLMGDPGQPLPPAERLRGRNRDWRHFNSADIISMPDKWEYPWFAAWDTAFHCVPLALVDAEFAKDQLILLTREWFMHPSGELPAYEWEFSDVNPPVHAWAAWSVFQIDRKQRGDKGDLEFLERVFHKLILNFTWWVNRKDAQGNNIFQGGFLGLDNIGICDRSSGMPDGTLINQADGTSWMAMYALNLMRIALELARHDRVYEDIASKFFEHFLQIAEAINLLGGQEFGLWDEEDAFYYDEISVADGKAVPLRVRSIVGLIPLFAVEVLDAELLKEVPAFTARMEWFLNYRPDLAALVSRWYEPGGGATRLLSLLRGHRMKCLLRRALDETEFLSTHGVRALSKAHAEHPFQLPIDGTTLSVGYEPGESREDLFGGNSNWRGPVWMPVNYLLVQSLERFHSYYTDEFRVECPTGSGQFLSIQEVSQELRRRLVGLFLPGPDGVRPMDRHQPRQSLDPHFRANLQFYEYFHGDSGRGCGASHQTGWTSLIAQLIEEMKTG